MVVFTKPFADADEAIRGLAGFDVLVAMRERTRFPAEVLERLAGLRLLVSTGPANAAIDVAAARERGITVCGTGYESHPAIEHTWALILGAARNLPADSSTTGPRELPLSTAALWRQVHQAGAVFSHCRRRGLA